MKHAWRNGLIILLAILLWIPAGLAFAADSVQVGDVDGDGELTVQDANCITRHLANFERLDAAQRSRADFDGDGLITSLDASLIMSALIVLEDRPKTEWSVSMLITADLSGMAWGSESTEQRGVSSALNLASCVAAEREQDPGILLIDAGGSIYGSTIADEYEIYTDKTFGPMTAAFAKLKYQAILLGDEAITYPSYRVRNEMDWIKASGTAVIGTNLVKANPTRDDPEITPWNEILPYTILEAEQEDGEPVRIGLIGLVEPDLAAPTDEVKAIDPKLCYQRIEKELRASCDMVVLLYHGNVEDDEMQTDEFSLRTFLRETSGIDFVLAAHGTGEGSREERSAVGKEIPIIQLPDSAAAVVRMTVSKREKGGFVYRTDRIDLRAYEQDEELKQIIRPYVSGISLMMDAPICTLEQDIEPYAADTLGSTDGMELLHEMQIWAAKTYLSENRLDMPPNVVSIAYPYLGTQGLSAGLLRYRDLCAIEATVPQYTLLMVRGEELRAWLHDYAGRIMQEKTIYSLYGLSYLFNTWNPDTPLGFLEYSEDVAVEDDDVFSVILAEDPDTPSELRAFLDETWMPYEDRVIGAFQMPQTRFTDTSEHYAAITPLVAFLERFDTFALRRLYSWIVL